MKKIAIMGFGTVGGGVARVLVQNSARIARELGEPVGVSHILVRRDMGGEYAARMTQDFSVIENDPATTLVVETIGGCGAAYEYTKRALSAGKHVVTANKELVAEHGEELLALAAQKGVRYLFEASVGGGIPILRPLRACLSSDEISEVYGILNGTTNYILTRMFSQGATFASALKEAQELGYAEADPTADVEGIDAGRKISILSALAFGEQVRPGDVSMQGITRIDAADVAICRAMGWRIKLLGRSVRLDDGSLCAYCAPHVVSLCNGISTVDDVYNAITVCGAATGDVMFYGRGAGALPTASAVVSDVVEALRGEKPRASEKWSAARKVCGADELASRWYIRAEDAAKTRALFADAEIWECESGVAAVTQPMRERELLERLGDTVISARLRVL